MAVGFTLARSQEGADKPGGVGGTGGIKVEVVAFVRLLAFCLAGRHGGDGEGGFDDTDVVTKANVTVDIALENILQIELLLHMLKLVICLNVAH